MYQPSTKTPKKVFQKGVFYTKKVCFLQEKTPLFGKSK